MTSPRMKKAVAAHTSYWRYNSFEAMRNMKQSQEYHYFPNTKEANEYAATLITDESVITYSMFSTGPQTCVSVTRKVDIK